MSNGRSVAEILRLVKALQTTDNNVCATRKLAPGDEVIVPPPATTMAAEARKKRRL